MGDYVTPAGLETPALEDVLLEIQTQERDEIDSQFDTDADSVEGNINGIVASHVREAYEVIEYIAASLDPDRAEGVFLDALCALTGSTREQPTKGKLIGTRRAKVNLNAGTTLPAGSVAHVDGKPENRWITTEVVGPAPLDGDYLVAMEAELAGVYLAPSGTLTAIATPFPGWNNVTNDLDAVPGTDVQDDESLRRKRRDELESLGSGTLETIRGDVLRMTADDGTQPIISCKVYENMDDVTSPLGLPPHSFEVLVWDGPTPPAIDDLIAQTIWDGKPMGIQVHGQISGDAIDAEGVTRVVPFSRVSQRTFTIAATIQVDSRWVGQTDTKAALVAIVREPAANALYDDYLYAIRNVAGVVRVVSIALNGGAPFTDVIAGAREILLTTSGSITLTVAP